MTILDTKCTLLVADSMSSYLWNPFQILPVFENGFTTFFVRFLAHILLYVFVFPKQCFLISLL